MTQNRQILAQMHAHTIIERMKNGPKPDPYQLLIQSLDEAIADVRVRLIIMNASGNSVGAEQLKAQLASWECSRMLNR